MEKSGGSGNEYVFNKRHDLNRNLDATILIYATVNNNSSVATLDAQVATSSRPFDSASTAGNYTRVMHGTVATGAGQRATDKAPTISINPSYVEIYNDEVLGGANGIPFVMKDDKGVLNMLADPNNTIITGLTIERAPMGKQGFKLYYSNRQDPKSVRRNFFKLIVFTKESAKFHFHSRSQKPSTAIICKDIIRIMFVRHTSLKIFFYLLSFPEFQNIQSFIV